jgi:hypothetical protein
MRVEQAEGEDIRAQLEFGSNDVKGWGVGYLSAVIRYDDVTGNAPCLSDPLAVVQISRTHG